MPKGIYLRKTNNGFKKGHKIWLGRNLTEEHKNKLRISKLGDKNPMFGKKQSVETIKKRGIRLLGKHHTEETKRKLSLGRLNEKGSNWKGDSVGYTGVHQWVYKQLGKPRFCFNCGNNDKAERSYQWANISKSYKRDVSDWIRLCVSCHQKWDRGIIRIII